MKFLSFSVFGIAIFLLFMVVFWINKPHQAYDCCPPPLLPPVAARFQQNAQVTVFLDKTSGFTDVEVQAIKAGLEDWNDEPNNSGIRYTVVETNNPPAPGGNNTIIASFVNSPGSSEAQLNLSDRRTSNGEVTNVSGVLTFWNNIRSGTPSLLPAFLRSTARHEGGHGIGLANADAQCPEGSNIMFPSRNQETFITECDNAIIKTDPVYPSPTPTQTPSPTPCAELNQSCYYPDDCCAGTICGNLTYVCILCEPNPQDHHQTCMSERCRDCYGNGGVFCTGEGNDCWTPIVIDVRGDGFDLTDADSGVDFNNGNGILLRTAWTAANDDDAWLVLDRNGNGSIDDGTELFGNATPQPPTNGLYNGFRALNEYDEPANGGNQDNYITNLDSVFSSLRLWQDTNHDGISTPSELHTLAALEVASIDLDYKLSKYKDPNGNTFKYRAKISNVKGAQTGRWVYDVFLNARRISQ